MIAVFNFSTAVTDAQVQVMCAALNKILPTFCADWALGKYTVGFLSKSRVNSTSGMKLFFYDDADAAGALGYHDLAGAVPYGKVFVRTTMNYGGGLYTSRVTGIPSVATVFAHEIFEMILDPFVNTWWLGTDWSTLWAAEMSDPVQGNRVRVSVNGVAVDLSDWILPAWSNPGAVRGPFNHNNTLSAPFTVDNYGYAIKMESGAVSYVFGASVPEETKAKVRTETRGFKGAAKTT